MTNGKTNSEGTNMQNLDKLFDEMLEGVDLPSDADIAEETRRAKISQTSVGKKASNETKQKIKNSHTGKNKSAETKEKISSSLKGYKQSKETIKKRSDKMKGISQNQGSKNGMARKVRTPLGIFNTLVEAGKNHNCTPENIGRRIRQNFDGYSYIDKKSSE